MYNNNIIVFWDHPIIRVYSAAPRLYDCAIRVHLYFAAKNNDCSISVY